jgi:hypothetical protein
VLFSYPLYHNSSAESIKKEITAGKRRKRLWRSDIFDNMPIKLHRNGSEKGFKLAIATKIRKWAVFSPIDLESIKKILYNFKWNLIRIRSASAVYVFAEAEGKGNLKKSEWRRRNEK